MSESTSWKDFKFERTVFADIKLAKICPGNNIKRIGEILTDDDTEKQFNSMMEIILIMNQAFIEKAKILEPGVEYKQITKADLLHLDEETFSKVTLIAMGKFESDGEVSVLAEPKKEEAEETELSSINPGISTLATPLE